MDVSSSPEVRPVSNILGENVSPLHAGELPNTNDKKDANASAHPKVSYMLNHAGNLFYV